jgi:hypothetical protein
MYIHHSVYLFSTIPSQSIGLLEWKVYQEKLPTSALDRMLGIRLKTQLHDTVCDANNFHIPVGTVEQLLCAVAASDLALPIVHAHTVCPKAANNPERATLNLRQASVARI